MWVRTPSHRGAAGRDDVRAPRRAAAEFVDLLVSDDEWVRQEFEALVEAGWGGDAPVRPASIQGPWWPPRPGSSVAPSRYHQRVGHPHRATAPPRQRGPPGLELRGRAHRSR